MVDIEKWKNRIENELTLSKDLCLEEMRLNFTRNDLIELNILLGSVSEIRNKAIEEFAEAIKSSQNVYTWCCTDSPMEFCGGDGCEMCVLRFKKEIDEIAESMKGGK